MTRTMTKSLYCIRCGKVAMPNKPGDETALCPDCYRNIPRPSDGTPLLIDLPEEEQKAYVDKVLNTPPSKQSEECYVDSRTIGNKIILDLCGGTGAWSRPYSEAGYDVRIIDPIRNTGDVRLMKKPHEKIHGILAAPPCTHFSASGARWWGQKGETALLEGLSVVDACMRIIATVRPVWWALENPVGRLSHYLGRPVMYFDPCDYGDPYTKKTCLWGDFTKPEQNPVEPTEGSKMHRLPPSPDRWKLRSQTPAAFAHAFFRANP